ncbi:ABC transporter substrate-binding protein [Spirulina sp. 06S082]|uniref:ABC transporter substrate-binding protein n=1 Tax=Spirulina sp. 06S082 TaxID=3110248 RepID=UPI002B1FCC9B|nr:ABC transporter substrate-binding protein [Spirulina sp. 06S082]MEA5469923.1 ABC transporter substrate-binding protein [Spirulina sp. 06S082]
MKRRDLFKTGTSFAAGFALAGALKGCGSPSGTEKAATTASTGDEEVILTVVQGGGFPNSLDLHRSGTNRPGYGSSWNLYDRLMTFDTKTSPDGSLSYDYTQLKPELAESWETEEGKSITFSLRKDATFHDGKPVTANDVKWSFDRAVSVGGFPTFQMKAGALEKPEQFVVIDDYTFQVKLLRDDKLTAIDLAVPIPLIINSELVKQHVTEDDPWGMEWVNNNDAGGGAFELDSFEPGKKLVLTRFDDWKSGPLPQIEKVILLDVPEAGNRRALLEKGDVDINFSLSEKDTKELKETEKYAIVSTPIENCLYSVDLNTKEELTGKSNPFADVKVRQAVAYAMPYQAMFYTALYGEAVKQFGAKSTKVNNTEWPQPSPYKTDMGQAKASLSLSNYPDGFETTLAFNLGTKEWAEPLCVLIQESLAEIGIKVTLEKVPGANFRSVLVEKSRPMIINNFGGWLNYPDYFFFYAYHGQDATFNGSSYKNPDMDKLIETALKSEPGKEDYEKSVQEFIQIAWDEVPRIPIVQPYLSIAMQKNIEGYQYWFHRQLDFRQLKKV